MLESDQMWSPSIQTRIWRIQMRTQIQIQIQMRSLIIQPSGVDKSCIQPLHVPEISLVVYCRIVISNH